MKTLKTTLTAALFGAALSTPALANPADVTRVTEGLIAVGMAKELSEVCNEVSARRLRGVNFLWSLKSHLNDLGYSDDQIQAYIDNDAEKDRLEAIARQRLSDLGAVVGQGATYCTVARAQMAQGTQIGQLLR